MYDFSSTSIEWRVLVLSATPKDFELTRGVLERAGVQSVPCTGVDDLCRKIGEGAGAVIVVEEAMSGESGAMCAGFLAKQPSWSDLPILVLARTGADSPGVAAAMDKLGNVTVLERPTRIAALVSAVRSALRARMRQYQVRDDAQQLEAARAELEDRVRERTAELWTANSQLEQKMRETEAAEMRARRLLRELVSAQENERARIARDLHDELGQQLTSLRLYLSQLDRDLPEDSPAHATLRATEKEAERIDSRVSFLAWMIRPTTIEELGLAEALAGYVREWSRNFDIEADFRGEHLPRARLLPEIEINVYRIAQECLNNVAKYAHATSVSVLMTLDQKELTLIIEDDGSGFDPSLVKPPSHDGGLGIRGMQERAQLLQGTFEIESSPFSGTAVYVRIPAKYRSEEQAVNGNGNGKQGSQNNSTPGQEGVYDDLPPRSGVRPERNKEFGL
jgi:signal transduction histidine kinase